MLAVVAVSRENLVLPVNFGESPAMADATTGPILYTQVSCAESEKVRAWLVDHGIPFTERDASADQRAASALAATGTFATPLLVIGDTTVLGFRPDALRTALQTHR